MGKMKDLVTDKAFEIALEKYDKNFCDLTEAEYNVVWALAEQAGQDWLAAQIDAERERRKYNGL